MGALKDIKTTDVETPVKDVINTSSYGVRDSDIYPVFINEAWLKTSNKGTRAVHFVFKDNEDGTGHTTELDVYFTNRKGETFYTRDNEKIPLPSFNTVDAICQIVTGKSLLKQKTGNALVEVYDYELAERVETQVEMLTKLVGKPIYLGLLKQIKDKTTLQDDGSYAPTGETREVNEIDKVFRSKDKKTIAEILANTEEPAEFYEQWLAHNKDRVVNRSKVTKNGPAGAAKSPGKKSIFDKKDKAKK